MMQFPVYIHTAKYYETDQMAIVHHSNYIRWFEDGRVHFMEQLGFGYREMEAQGIVSPVLSVACSFRSMVRFHDRVMILPKLDAVTGAKITLSYRIIDLDTRELRAEGESRHGFLDAAGHPISLKKAKPEVYEVFSAACGKDVWELP